MSPDTAPEKRALLDTLTAERFTHLPQHPKPDDSPARQVQRRIRLVVDDTRRTA